MEYSILADTYERLEQTSSKLEKTNILSNLFSKVPAENLQKVVLLCQGLAYPKYQMMELGIATQMMIRAISKSTGFNPEQVEQKFKETGDLGLAAEECIKSKKQVTLLKKKLTINFVFEDLRKLAVITGRGSQDRKLNLISELIVSAQPKEARYIVRTILEELRVGAAEGIIRDSIVKAFLLKNGTKEEKKKATEVLEHAWNIVTDFGEIAMIAKERGLNGLKKVKVHLGRPIQVMLGEKAESIKVVLDEFKKLAIEKKYDGARIQVHKQENKIWLFTRREEDVTKQFPDLVELCRKALRPNECIVEGEVLGVNSKGQPLPFQVLSQRIHRKHDIERVVKEIPIQMNLFDVVFVEGKMLFNKPFKERRKILEQIVKIIPNNFQIAEEIVTDDLKKAQKFYKKSLEDKQEGVMMKVLDSTYVFGRHVGGWYKVKPMMETLDLVIIGATWGEGTRANWLTSYNLACRDSDTGKMLECGMMSTGLTEEEYNQMTDTLKPLISIEKGRTVKVNPKIVLEVGYEEIQKSTNYKSGFALRFPRFIRLRPEKGPEEADTIERVEELYKSQGKTS